MEIKLIKYYFFLTILFQINCYSSRDRCYRDNYEFDKFICEISPAIKVKEGDGEGLTEIRKQNAMLLLCLEAELQRKSCDSKTNLDVRN